MLILIKIIKNPFKILGYLAIKGVLRWLPDRPYLKILYRSRINRILDLDSPKSFNEKLQWLKIHDRNLWYTDLVDKYTVREYIKKTIGEEYLVPLIGVYNTAEEIDYSVLPKQFVLKPTHTSGDVIICRDKDALHIKDTTKKLNKWLKRDYYWYQREWPYKNIKPRIICEELLVDESGYELKDYKIFCFNGIPKFAYVASDRSIDTKFDFFDIDWNWHPVSQHYPNKGIAIKKPKKWDELLSLARLLSHNIPHVRVDFYIDSSESIYFGELTFYHMSGLHAFTPESYDYLLGSWIDLSLVDKNQKEDDIVKNQK